MDEYIERETLLNSICNKHCDCDYDGECPNCRLTEPIVALLPPMLRRFGVGALLKLSRMVI